MSGTPVPRDGVDARGARRDVPGDRGPGGGPGDGAGLRIVRDGGGGARADAVGAWLDVLCSLLDLPRRERESIREELDEHLRERVRDLVLSGRDEAGAVSGAIAELGDAASLARRYHEASRAPRRRRIMNMSLVGLAGAAVIAGAVALRGGQPAPPASVFQGSETRSSETGARVSVETDESWGDFFERAGKAAGQPVYVHWSTMREISSTRDGGVTIDEGTVVGVEAPDFPLARALEIINDQLAIERSQRVDFRSIDGRLEFATVDYFDRRETVLATFDLAPVIEERRASRNDPSLSVEGVLEEASDVLTAMVQPDLWTDNGGDLATLSRFDTRLFVRAPRRMMDEIRWVIGEMSKGAGVGGEQ